jgi:hypothetical protein
MRLLLIVALLALAGCQQAPSPTDTSAKTGGLPNLARSASRPLQAELALLVQERGTPWAIDDAVRATWPASSQPQGSTLLDPNSVSTLAEPSGGTLIAGLSDLFSSLERQSLFQEASSLWPKGEFRFTSVDLAAIREFNALHADKRQRLRQLLSHTPPLGHLPSQSFTSDYSYLDRVSLAHHLEGFIVAEMLVADRPQGSLEPLDIMFLLARLLDEGHAIPPRLAAARLRGETLQVVRAVANHPRADAELRGQLADLLHLQTSRWPSEAETLRGERAAGLEVYERVRRGELASLLKPEEYDQLVRDFRLSALCRTVQKNVDADELFYLTSLRRIIAQGEQPYYQRRETLHDIQQHFETTANTIDDCYVARTLLLAGFDRALQLMAEDRARCEAWELALTQSVGIDGPDFSANPLTGEPYDVADTPSAIVVQWSDAAQAIRVAK